MFFLRRSLEKEEWVEDGSSRTADRPSFEDW